LSSGGGTWRLALGALYYTEEVDRMMLIGERRALVSIVFVFFALIYLLNGVVGPPQLAPLFLGLAAVYGIGFFGVVACWFWARWYAMGVALSGASMSIMLAYQIGLEPFVLFYGGTHALAALLMLGQGPVSSYEGRRDWRERWKLDDNAVNRLGRSVTRAGASIPYLVMAALAPREQGMAMIALGLGVAGVVGLVKLRTWSLAAFAGAAVAIAAFAGFDMVGSSVTVFSGAPWIAAGLLALAIAPFAAPVIRTLAARR
jgi:hypothetical protein